MRFRKVLTSASIRRHHKWLGLILCSFIFLTCLSGLVMNHRSAWADVNISRKWLPPHYRYLNWNQGLMKGSLAIGKNQVCVYGTSGMMVSNPDGSFEDYNQGLPEGADHRVVKGMAFDKDSILFAATQYGLYQREHGTWKMIDLPLQKKERLSDVCAKGDTLVVASRNRIFLSTFPYTQFSPIDLQAPTGYDGKVSLFRIVWLIHSGELLGLPGKIFIDLVALILIFLSLSGILIWILPKCLRLKRVKNNVLTRWGFKWNFKNHRRIGVYGLILLLFVTITGWMLRPPLLIPLALNKTTGIAGTTTDPAYPWFDKIRALQYDAKLNDWLLSTSDGLFTLNNDLTGQPLPVAKPPYIGVMGPTVMHQRQDGKWLIGSLSGLFIWDRSKDIIIDWHTGQPDSGKSRPPFGNHPVSGYSEDFGQPAVVDYYEGTNIVSQPTEYETLPMSLFGVALEIHTGRIYHLFGLAPYIWIFLFGSAMLWLLISGYLIHAQIKSSKLKSGVSQHNIQQSSKNS